MHKTHIPILDLSPEIDHLWNDLQAAIQGVLRSGHFIMGPNVREFEKEVASYLGVKHAITLNSGTDALVIALKAFGVGNGDEVITTPFTFFATAEAIDQVGATPVFVDVTPESFNIDPSLIEAAVTSKTKAILPVHLYGQAADMDSIMTVAMRHGLVVIEDVAQAFGAEYRGRKVGTIGKLGAYSFFPSKNLGAYGDGGLVVTDDDQLAELCQMLRAHGAKRKYHNEIVGYNSRLDELQSAVLRVKLPHIDRWNEARREKAHVYNELLSGLDGCITPVELEGRKHVFHQYTVRLLGGKRDDVQKRLAEAGISTMVYYPIPVHRLPVYAGRFHTMPVAEQLATEVLSLPIWPQIELEVQQEVASQLRKALCRTSS